MRIEVTRKRIKNMYLRVTDDGRIVVSAPLRASDKEIRTFVESRADWIKKALTRAETRAENLPD